LVAEFDEKLPILQAASEIYPCADVMGGKLPYFEAVFVRGCLLPASSAV
jgi:hypothetical protein